MKQGDYLLSLGIMTGNSLDGVDLVLVAVSRDGAIYELYSHYEEFPASLADEIRRYKVCLREASGDIAASIAKFDSAKDGDCSSGGAFERLHQSYLGLISKGIRTVEKQAQLAVEIDGFSTTSIDIVGFHGQTCGHCPPSISSTGLAGAYTAQLGNGMQLAELTGITVVHDFRSDDLMAGGEGAPLAPRHHYHLSEQTPELQSGGIAFCNGGNTGNLTLISTEKITGRRVVLGWDTGPFNHFTDLILQRELGERFDRDGLVASQGKVNLTLLRLLFDTACIDDRGRNLLAISERRSLDPAYYRLPPQFLDSAGSIALGDRVRTALYFAVYQFVYSFNDRLSNVLAPARFALCGGGWNNPIAVAHLNDLVSGNYLQSPLLDEHREVFRSISAEFSSARDIAGLSSLVIAPSEAFGWRSQTMEARIFADAAVARIKREPFGVAAVTGADGDTVSGVISFPNGKLGSATHNLQRWIAEYGALSEKQRMPQQLDRRFGRAVSGWPTRITDSSDCSIGDA